VDKEDLKFFTVGASIGAVVGLGLSFAALSPLVIGGIVGSVPIAVLCMRSLLDSKAPKDKELPIRMGIATITAAAVGVACGDAASYLFPDVMLSLWTAALVGFVIGAIGIMSGLLAEKYIIDPVITKVAKCFSKEVSA